MSGTVVYSQEFGAFLVLALMMALFLCFTVGMLIYHTYLILSGTTTYEMSKGHRLPYMKGLADNPFSEGVVRNCWGVCCHRK